MFRKGPSYFEVIFTTAIRVKRRYSIVVIDGATIELEYTLLNLLVSEAFTWVVVWLLISIVVSAASTPSATTELRAPLTFKLNISLEAKLEIYTKRTISPPKKIKNRIYENQFIPVTTQINVHRIIVWAKIININITGWDLFIKVILISIEATITNLISAECSL